MKKALLLLAMVCLPLFASAQTKEKQYYIYNIVTFSGSLKNEGFKVDLDDGLLQPLPPEVEAELDKILDAEDID